MKNYGIRVLIKKNATYGFITRRMNAQCYEIDVGGDVVYLHPDEFIEIEEKDQKK